MVQDNTPQWVLDNLDFLENVLLDVGNVFAPGTTKWVQDTIMSMTPGNYKQTIEKMKDRLYESEAEVSKIDAIVNRLTNKLNSIMGSYGKTNKMSAALAKARNKLVNDIEENSQLANRMRNATNAATNHLNQPTNTSLDYKKAIKKAEPLLNQLNNIEKGVNK